MRWLWIVERVIILLRYRMPLPSRVGRMSDGGAAGGKERRKGHGRSLSWGHTLTASLPAS